MRYEGLGVLVSANRAWGFSTALIILKNYYIHVYSYMAIASVFSVREGKRGEQY